MSYCCDCRPGVAISFVGFFFLRLYVANELDLKHNKDAPSKKEIMKSLAQTERNFVLKKNERSASTELLSEYNDRQGARKFNSCVGRVARIHRRLLRPSLKVQAYWKCI